MRGLYALKPWYTARLTVFVTAAVRRGLSPDVFTALGVAAGAAAGVALAAGWWAPAGVLLAARLAGANLDGAVARARGVSRPWGFVLNEIGDRASDLLMFAGLAVLAGRHAHVGPSGGHTVLLVLIAAAAATLPTFAALSAAGAGATRRNGGPLGKTERCALAVIGCAFPSVLGAVAALIAVGSLATTALRLRATHTELNRAADGTTTLAEPSPVGDNGGSRS